MAYQVIGRHRGKYIKISMTGSFKEKASASRCTKDILATPTLLKRGKKNLRAKESSRPT